MVSYLSIGNGLDCVQYLSIMNYPEESRVGRLILHHIKKDE